MPYTIHSYGPIDKIRLQPEIQQLSFLAHSVDTYAAILFITGQ